MEETPVVTASSAEWLTAIGTVGSAVLALFIALFGRQMARWFYRPKLDLDAQVRIPDAQKVGQFNRTTGAFLGNAWYFRLAITNSDNAPPARDVQVYLEKVEKVDKTRVDRFSPMNLKWTHKDKTTREVLLAGIPAFCDFIHIMDPHAREASRENLATVSADKGVLCLDVEVQSSANAHLLEPGAYLFYLVLAAENFRAQRYTVEVRYNGNWFEHEQQMLDQEIGFKMKKVEPVSVPEY